MTTESGREGAMTGAGKEFAEIFGTDKESEENPVRIMVSTGEASGDMHGANLVKALKKRLHPLEICGMGGTALESEGVEILVDAQKISVMGITEVVAHGKDIFAAQRILRKKLREWQPHLLIIIDLPDFNLLLAKVAKKRNIPVYYYICPQVWAWRGGRVKTLQKRVDALGVILPFEEEFYRSHGLSAHYVGHPLLDAVRRSETCEEFAQRLALSHRCIGILPGSRRREVQSLLPIFLRAAERLASESDRPLTFLLPKASTISHNVLEEAGLAEYRRKIDIRVTEDVPYETMAACDVVVTASGTVTLELALLDVPSVVAYVVAPVTYVLGKMLVKLRFFSLVNLVAGREIVPELLQHEVTAERICAELSDILNSPERCGTMREGLAEVRAKLGKSGASARVAEDIVKLLRHRGVC